MCDACTVAVCHAVMGKSRSGRWVEVGCEMARFGKENGLLRGERLGGRLDGKVGVPSRNMLSAGL